MSAAANVVHIVASCADRKRIGCGPVLQMRAFRCSDLDVRIEKWWGALSANAPKVAARDLYVGPYWSTIRELSEAGSRAGWIVNTWVASAGYGLVPEGAPVRAYSATFRTSAADAVVRRSDVMRGYRAKQWWNALAGQPAIGWRAPRRVAAIAKKDPTARIIVVGSSSYIAAMEDDLAAAISIQGSCKRLVIVSGDARGSRSDLHDSWVETSAKLLSRVGGSLPALHARVARQILRDSPRFGLDATTLRTRWAEISDRSPEAMKPVRTQATDEEVKSFIRESLQQQPSLKHTKLLRDFRTAGRACEQSRFRSLFLQVAGEPR